MTHDEAMALASARADGEPYDATALDAHLSGCAECAAYAAGLGDLGELARALPRASAPPALPHRVARAIRSRRRRRWALRTAPALAAATAVAVALTSVPVTGPASFPLPEAAAAAPLLELTSLYVERTVVDGNRSARERIWWRAPGFVRVERDGVTTIRTPDSDYRVGIVTTNAAPEIALPEPLSPTVQLFGKDTGAGPVVAGRATRRYELVVGNERRLALVDAERAVALGADESVVLGKQGLGVSKRVTLVTLNEPMGDELFTPPPGAAPRDGGFRRRDLADLGIAPRARPAGFDVVTAGRGPEGEAALLARGSLPVLVRSGDHPPPLLSEVRPVVSGGRPYDVTFPLYGVPSVAVPHDGGVVTVSAALPAPSLVALALAMYPPAE